MSNTNRDLEPEDAQRIEKRIDALLEKTFWELEEAAVDLGHWNPKRFEILSDQIYKAIWMDSGDSQDHSKRKRSRQDRERGTQKGKAHMKKTRIRVTYLAGRPQDVGKYYYGETWTDENGEHFRVSLVSGLGRIDRGRLNK